MQAENKKILVSNAGTNRTVLRTVCDVLDSSKLSVLEWVKPLEGCSFEEACYSIFWYIIDNVEYREDPGNNQFVKTPARLLLDGYGDCKSMAIFAAACLYSLGYDCSLRFVSFTNHPIYTHVYVVARNGGRQIIIDPVERVNGQPKFNYAQPFTLKYDVKCI